MSIVNFKIRRYVYICELEIGILYYLSAEEVLSSIRTVVAFGGQDKEVERYESKLVYAKKAGLLRGILVGVGGGFMWLIIYSSYALAFWYGVKLIMDDREKCFDSVFEDCDVR